MSSTAGGTRASGAGGLVTKGGNASGSTTTAGGTSSTTESGAAKGGSDSTSGSSESVGGGEGGTKASGGNPGGGNASLGTTSGTETSAGSGGRSNATGGSPSSGGTVVGGSGSADEAIAPSQCRAYWDFETLADGKVTDVSGHDVTLTVNMATLAEGPRGNYLSLTGTNSSAAASAAVIDATASFSISVWAKLDQLGSFSTIVSQDGKNVSSFYLQKRSSGRLALATFPSDSTDAAGCITEAAIQPRAGEWYHLVATRDATTREQRIYVDGMLSGTSTCAGGFATTSPLVVGRGRWDGEVDWTTGGVDDLCMLDHVMTPAEAADLYRKGRPAGKNYLFAYFAEQAQGRGDGLRLAQSHDALYWGAIGGGKVFLPPTVGGKSFRDPHVMRDLKGTYHVVWTTSCVPWAESGCVQDKGFGHAQSADLVHFSDPTYVTVDMNVEHVWAPETFYDAAAEQYMVYWSSPPVGSPHSIYYMLTKDFASFSKPAVLYSRSGRNFIDATIIEQSGGYLMFLKDEADGQKNIRALSSNALYGTGAWSTDPSNALTGSYAAEGPSALLSDGNMHLFFDKYGDGKYGALLSNGLSNLTAPASWKDISSSVFFAGVRHGTPIEVPWDVYRAVARKAGE